MDGPVSFILDWTGLKFSFSSGTYPNKWWIEHTKGSDLAIHECFAPPSIMVKKQRFAVLDALNVATQVHTSPAMFGKVMSMTQPRMAVATTPSTTSTPTPDRQGGPLDLRRTVRTRRRLHGVQRHQEGNPRPLGGGRRGRLAEPLITEKLSADPKDRIGFSRYVISGRQVFKDVIDQYYRETNKMFGTNYQPPK